MLLNKLFLIGAAMMGLVVISCVQQNTESNQSASLTATEVLSQCHLDQSNVEKISQDCVDLILAKLPFLNLLRTLPPSNRVIQEIIKDRVTGYWPQWLLDDIKQEGKEKFGERLVHYYYAFLKLQTLLANSKTRLGTIPRTILPNESHSWFMGAGMIGDHAVAYYERANRKLTLYDLNSHEIVSQGVLPNGGVDGEVAQIHELSDNTFLLIRNGVQDGIRAKNTEFTMWRWGAHRELELLNTVNSHASHQKFGFLGSSGQNFATWRYKAIKRKGEPKVVDFWNHQGLVKSVELPPGLDILTYSDVGCTAQTKISKMIDFRSQLLKSLKYLEQQGITISLDHLGSQSKLDIGYQVDKRTLLSSNPVGGDLILSSLDYKNTVPFIGGYDSGFRTSLRVRLINKNGDMVFWSDEGVHDLGAGISSANLWKILKKVVAASE